MVRDMATVLPDGLRDGAQTRGQRGRGARSAAPLREWLAADGGLLRSDGGRPFLPAIQYETILLVADTPYGKRIWKYWKNTQEPCPAQSRACYFGKRKLRCTSLHIESMGLEEEPLIGEE